MASLSAPARRLTLAFVAGVVLVPACSELLEPDPPPPAYLITETSPGSELTGLAEANAVNDQGFVAGKGPGGVPVLWSPEILLPLVPDGGTGTAYDVNELAQIVGEVNLPFLVAFRWDQSNGYVILPKLPDGEDKRGARAINDAGEIVGWATKPDGSTHAVYWSTDLVPADLTPNSSFAEANDINSDGLVVGRYVNGAGENRGFKWHPNTGFEELPAPFGGIAWANAVNDAGQIAGVMTNESGLRHAVLWDTGGAIVDLGSVAPHPFSDAYDIREDGMVVGEAWGAGTSLAAVWDPDTQMMMSLGEGEAHGINTSAMVVGRNPLGRGTRWQITVGEAPSIELTVNDTSIRPWIRQVMIGKYRYDSIPPDTALLNVRLQGFPSEAPLVIRGEYRGEPGGHEAHLEKEDWPLEEMPDLTTRSPDAGLPVAGFFVQGSEKTERLTLEDPDSVVDARFVAGYFGGDIRIIAEATIGSDTLADTVFVRVEEPGLDLPLTKIDSVALFVGWTDDHPGDRNWHLVPHYADSLLAIVRELNDTTPNNRMYVQVNDASLPLGGTFRVVPPANLNPFGGGHGSHHLGIDVDLAWCLSTAHGNPDGTSAGEFAAGRVAGTNCSTTKELSWDALKEAAENVGAYAIQELGRSPHYHVRFNWDNPFRK